MEKGTAAVNVQYKEFGRIAKRLLSNTLKVRHLLTNLRETGSMHQSRLLRHGWKNKLADGFG